METDSQQFLEAMPTKPMMTGTIEVQPAPPLPKLIVKVAPLAVEKAFPEVLEARSSTVMIQSVLGELTSERKIVEAQVTVEEEEGSSSTQERRT